LPKPGDRLAGRYVIDRVIGGGGMGMVYAAHHDALEKPVAIKILLPDLVKSDAARARFEREARVASRLSHPGAVGVHDFGYDDGLAFLVMDLLVGPTLRQVIDRGPLPIDALLRLGVELSAVLVAAHELGLVHRDLKPENVVFDAPVGGEARAVVVDFGLAFLAEGEGGLGRLTRDGMIAGTPHYVSPEQARGLPLGPPSDLYALGCVLYEAGTGTPPFDSHNAAELLAQHMFVAAPLMRTARAELPEALEALVASLLRKSQSERPTASDARDVLVGLATGASPSGRGKPARTRASRMIEPSPAPPVPSASDAVIAVVGVAVGVDLATTAAVNGLELLPVEGAAAALALGTVDAVFAPDATTDDLERYLARGLPVVAAHRSGDMARLMALLRAGATDVITVGAEAADVVQKLVRAVRTSRAHGPGGGAPSRR
jgi:serine/threonine-protein kinase